MHVMCIMLFSSFLCKIPYLDFLCRASEIKILGMHNMTLLELDCPALNLAE
jgi:hypothetical protein